MKARKVTVILPVEDEGLIDLSAGKPVHWLEGTGWVKDSA